nr:MAG TPA: Protein of unknown function (DUF551) [Caudoviricetes sp.]
MNVLEKILEEINEKIKFAERMMVEKPCDKLDEIANDTAESFISAYEACGETIRSHIDEVPNCEGCSRRKWYQKGFEDGKKDSGWIPVEEKRVPEKEVIAQNVYNEMMIGYVYYSEEMKWYECVSDDVYLTNVVAWQPRPEPYIKNPK